MAACSKLVCVLDTACFGGVVATTPLLQQCSAASCCWVWGALGGLACKETIVCMFSLGVGCSLNGLCAFPLQHVCFLPYRTPKTARGPQLFVPCVSIQLQKHTTPTKTQQPHVHAPRQVVGINCVPPWVTQAMQQKAPFCGPGQGGCRSRVGEAMVHSRGASKCPHSFTQTCTLGWAMHAPSRWSRPPPLAPFPPLPPQGVFSP